MRIWLDLPDDVVAQLSEQGQDLSRSALEALAIDAYRMQRLTSHQLCRLLGIPSRDELDRFLKHHGVPLEYTLEDFEREGATSARLWEKRKHDLATKRTPERQSE
jgi:predicted HTH domain antitoxin